MQAESKHDTQGREEYSASLFVSRGPAGCLPLGARKLAGSTVCAEGAAVPHTIGSMLRTLGYRLSGLRLLLPATPSSWTHALQDCCPSRALGSTNQRAFRGSVYSLNTEANEAKDEKKQAESPDGAASSEDGSEAEPVDAEKLQVQSIGRSHPIDKTRERRQCKHRLMCSWTLFSVSEFIAPDLQWLHPS